jgi:hypothetical protein
MTLERVYPPKLMFLVADPVMRFAVGRLGAKPPGLALLRFTGRRSGRDLELLAALHEVDGRRAVLTNSGWRWNFEGGRPLEAIIEGQSHRLVGTLETDPDAVADVYLGRLSEIGVEAAPRRLGIRSTTGEAPTREEMAAFADAEGLGVVYLDPAD